LIQKLETVKAETGADLDILRSFSSILRRNIGAAAPHQAERLDFAQ